MMICEFCYNLYKTAPTLDADFWSAFT